MKEKNNKNQTQNNQEWLDKLFSNKELEIQKKTDSEAFWDQKTIMDAKKIDQYFKEDSQNLAPSSKIRQNILAYAQKRNQSSQKSWLSRFFSQRKNFLGLAVATGSLVIAIAILSDSYFTEQFAPHSDQLAASVKPKLEKTEPTNNEINNKLEDSNSKTSLDHSSSSAANDTDELNEEKNQAQNSFAKELKKLNKEFQTLATPRLLKQAHQSYQSENFDKARKVCHLLWQRKLSKKQKTQTLAIWSQSAKRLGLNKEAQLKKELLIKLDPQYKFE